MYVPCPGCKPDRRSQEKDAEITRLRAEVERLQEKLGQIPEHLQRIADGIATRAEKAERDLAEERAHADRLAEALGVALPAVDEAYQATGYFRVARTSAERLAIEAALAEHEKRRAEG